MLNFDERQGDRTDVAYPDTTVPEWFQDAKVGLMIHWGIYSIPAWAVTSDERFSAAEEYAFHRYAEWYGNTVRIPGSPTALLHRARYGSVAYEDLVDRWQIRSGAVEGMVALASAAGARYVVPTTKHHDGLCLWDTQTTSFPLFAGPSHGSDRGFCSICACGGATAGALFFWCAGLARERFWADHV